jgi:nicotinate-nucleotide--dimethylbenzimidazole phosphoribosyltransferase
MHMTRFATFGDLREVCAALPAGDDRAADAVRTRQLILTKPPGSLGKLEDLAVWLARWQGREMPRLERVEILVFAGNHGVVAQGVSPFPPEVTAQMVENFATGGAAINQLAACVGATLRVIPLDLATPTRDMTEAPALDEAAFLAAAEIGFASVAPNTDLLALGEMGIGNTTSAAALAAALFGGGGKRWAGRGTGLDDAGLLRKQAVVDAALLRHATLLNHPLLAAMALGGRELAAILGAVLATRLQRTPVLLDGFVCTAAAAPLARIEPTALDHTRIAHRSAEAGHGALAAELGLEPILDLGMRLGEASGAAVAIAILRAAVACHTGMATFAEAGVRNRA